MTEPSPLAERTVAATPILGPLGLVAVAALLGLIILGAHTLAVTFRSLDQGAADGLPGERSPE